MIAVPVPSASGSVDGARHTNRSHTYTAGFPSTRPFPSSSGTAVRRADRDDRVRRERCERRACDRAVDRPDDRDLAGRREPQVERAQHPAERARCAAEHRLDEPQHRHGLALELVVAPDPPEAEQDVREHRVARRDRVVVEALRARDELLAARRGEEEAAVLGDRRTARPRAARAGAPRASQRTSPVATCSSISPCAAFA